MKTYMVTWLAKHKEVIDADSVKDVEIEVRAQSCPFPIEVRVLKVELIGEAKGESI